MTEQWVSTKARILVTTSGYKISGDNDEESLSRG